MNRREVHRIADHAFTEEIADGGRGVDADQLLCFFGRRRDMRRGDDLRQLGERPIARRLVFEHVKRRAGDDAALDRSAKRRFVDEIAARRVDDADSGLAPCEALVVEQMLGFRRRRQMQRQVVGRARTARRATAARRRCPSAMSREIYGSCATIRMPKRRARWPLPGRCGRDRRCRASCRAARCPGSFFFSHLPSFIARSAAGTDRASASISAQACSATLMLLAPGALTTRMPRALAGADVDVVDAGAGAARRCAAAARRRAARVVTFVALRTISASASARSVASWRPGVRCARRRPAGSARSRSSAESGDRRRRQFSLKVVSLGWQS